MAINNTDPREIGTSGLSGLKGINQRKLPKYIDLSYNQDVNTARQASKYSGIYATKSGIGANTNPDYGSSMFDTNVENMGDILDLNEVRANSLWGIAKLGAGALKAVTTAGTTAANTLGLIYGVGRAGYSAIMEDKPWYEDISMIWNNEFTNSIQQVDQLMEEILPLYRSREEQENEWYLNIGTANFWADFTKLIGFTVGAFYGGAAWNAALKGVGLLKSASAAGKLGTLISAAGEGVIEANNGADDWEKLEMAKLKDKYEPLVREAYDNPDYFEKVGENSMKSHRALLKERYDAEVLSIKDRKTQMGNWILTCNVPLLMAGNLIQFNKLYQAGFNSSKRAAGTAYKEGNKYFWKNITKGRSFGKGVIDASTEGFEEMNQMWISEGAGIALQYDSPDAYYKALTDPKAEKDTKGFVKGITEGFSNSYGDLSKYQDFAMGMLTGLLGVPTFGKSNNSSHNTYLGRNKSIGLSGGVFGEFSSDAYSNERGALAVEGINQYLLNTANRARHLVADNALTDLMNGYAAEGNSFEWHNAADTQEFNAIDNFALVGLLDDYKLLIDRDFDNATLEDLIEIAESTKNQLTGLYLFLDATGQSLAVTNPEEMRLKLNDKKLELIDGVNKYEEFLGQMRSVSGIQDNDDAVRELAWLKWKIDRFLTRRLELAEQSLPQLTLIIENILTLNETYTQNSLLMEEQGLAISESEALDRKAMREMALETSALLTILNKIKTDVLNKTNPKYRLNKVALDKLASDDFFDDYVEPTGLTYDLYDEAILNLVDLTRIDNLAKLFNDRLKYYLDESLPNKHTKQQSSTEDKVNGDHAERDNQVAEDNAIQLAQETQEEVNNILTLEDLDNAVLNNGLETVNAVIDDIALTEPNHPAVETLKISNLVDLIKDTINTGVFTNESIIALRLLDLVRNVANSSSSELEFKDNLLNNSDDAIAEAFGFNSNAVGTNTTRRDNTVSTVKLQLSDLFNKNAEDVNTSQLLANPTPVTPSTTPQLTTGSDDNVSNDTSLTTPNTNTTDELILQSIDKWKKQGIGDNLIILKGVDAGIPRERMLELMDIYNEANKPVTEEEGAITPTYTSEQGTNVETTLETLNNLELQDPKSDVDIYKFFITSTTEYPTTQDITNNARLYAEKGWITITGTNAQGKPIWKFSKDAFDYDDWVYTHKAWPDRLKESLKVRHLYLKDNHAYERISHGELLDVTTSKPTEISLVTYASVNEEANDLVIFLVDLNGHVLGDLPSALSTVSNKYPGLLDITKLMDTEYRKTNKDYTYPIKTHVSKIMLGRPSYSVDNHTIGEIQAENKKPLYLGICTNESRGTIKTANSDRKVIPINEDKIVSPLKPKKGQIYVLLPNGRNTLDFDNYTPVLCTAPRVGADIKGTIIATKIKESLEEMLSAKEYGKILTAFGKLDNYVYIPDISIVMFNGDTVLSAKRNNTNLPVTRIKFLDKNGKEKPVELLDTILDDKALSRVMNMLSLYRGQGAPVHINISFINKSEDDIKMYNEIVRTNLPIDTETTINDWFTINPIIDGKELKAESPRTTGVNPNRKPTRTTYPANGINYELDSIDGKVYVNNVVQTPLDTNNPLHLTSYVNALMAWDWYNKNSQKNPQKVGNAVSTPYGWYNIVAGKLVTEPVVELPMLVLGKVNRGSELIVENQQPSSLKISDEDSRKSQLEILDNLLDAIVPVPNSNSPHYNLDLSTRERKVNRIREGKSSSGKQVRPFNKPGGIPFTLQDYIEDAKEQFDIFQKALEELKKVLLQIGSGRKDVDELTRGITARRDMATKRATEALANAYKLLNSSSLNLLLTSSLELTHSSSLEVLLTLLLEVDPNYLGKGIINGLEREIYKLDLEEALDFLGNEVTYNSPIEEIAKFIERFENSFEASLDVITETGTDTIDYESMTYREVLSNRDASLDTNALKVLDDIYHMSGNSHYLDLVEVLMPIFKNSNLPVYFTDHLSGSKTAGSYYHNDTIFILKRNSFNEEIPTILHELLHAATVYKYEHDSEFKDIIDSLYNKAKEHLSYPYYGLTDSKEFISEALTDMLFMLALSNLKETEIIPRNKVIKYLANKIDKLSDKLIYSDIEFDEDGPSKVLDNSNVFKKIINTIFCWIHRHISNYTRDTYKTKILNLQKITLDIVLNNLDRSNYTKYNYDNLDLVLKYLLTLGKISRELYEELSWEEIELFFKCVGV